VEHRRRRFRLREVVAPLLREAEVGRERGCEQNVPDGVPRAHEVEQEVGGDLGDEKGQRCCGKDAAGAPRVEARQRDPSGLLGLGEEDAGDQEAGDDEEDVNADEAALDPVDAGVPEHDEQHCEPAQPLDVLPMSKRTRHRPERSSAPLTRR
jgi:hypothetical protein